MGSGEVEEEGAKEGKEEAGKEERGGKLGWGKMEVEWHYDGFDQVILCVAGSGKTFSLAPPVCEEPVSGWLSPGEFPAKSQVEEVTLHPGDVMFLPARVCHQVSTVGLSLTVNWGFISEAGAKAQQHAPADAS
ncbi:hypothetical protein T484DRAFT_1981060 [Baffinella frigidus]|nr:hypothetical protein T484DRAFT_1981060 [Cryptophyta sp. CCMP2293]